MVQYTLDKIVREYLIETGENTENRYMIYLQYAISGLRELNIDVSGVPKVARLEINDIDCVEIPPDFINYTRIAICSNGILLSLGKNNDICLNRGYNDCGEYAMDDTDNTGGVYYAGNSDGYGDHFRNGEGTGRLFGTAGGYSTNGSYRFDLARGLIQLSGLSTDATEVVLEYLANPEMIDGEFVVHPFIVNTLKSWIRYQKEINRPNGTLGKIDLLRTYYLKDRMESERRFGSATITEWLQAFRSGNQLTPKI